MKTVEVTIARGRCVLADGREHLPGETLQLPVAEARELDQHGFIEPLDGGDRPLTSGPPTSSETFEGRPVPRPSISVDGAAPGLVRRTGGVGT